MDVIKKNIFLEPFIIRFKSESPSIRLDGDETCNWGDISYDYIVKDNDILLDLKDTLPLSIELKKDGEKYITPSGETNVNVLRYRTMISWISWLNEFILGLKIYETCNKKGNLSLIDRTDYFNFRNYEIDYGNEIIPLSAETVYMCSGSPYSTKVWAIESGNTYSVYDSDGNRVTSDTPNAERINQVIICDEIYYVPDSELSKYTGIYVILTENPNYFLNIFSPIKHELYDAILHVNRLYEFYDECSSSGVTENDISIPYASINMVITQDIDNIGKYSSVPDYWIPNKRYYINDVVLNGDDNLLYKLIRGENLEDIDVPNQMYDFIKEELESGEIYKPFNEDESEIVKSDTAHTYVDVRKGIPNYKFVVPYYCGYYNEHTRKTYFDNPNEPSHWELVESCLDDNIESGDTKTFILESRLNTFLRGKESYDDDNNKLPFILNFNESGDAITELRYIVNSPNGGYFDDYGDYRYNVINKVIVENNSGNTEEITGGTIEYSDNVFGESGKITFIYYLGAVLGSDDKPKGGIKYTDVYNYTVDEITFTLGTAITVNYVNIIYVTNPEISPISSGKIYSIAEVSESLIKTDNFLCFDYVKDDGLLGVEGVNINYDDYIIDRGTSSAFERHLVLGEISSFEDLEKYKNGFFNLTTI